MFTQSTKQYYIYIYIFFLIRHIKDHNVSILEKRVAGKDDILRKYVYTLRLIVRNLMVQEEEEYETFMRKCSHSFRSISQTR